MNKNKFLGQPVLIWDVECETKGNKPDGNVDILRVFGCYSYLDDKYHFLTKPSKIREIIRRHKYLVGFNTTHYDNKVMFNNKFDDLMYVFKNGNHGFTGKYSIDLRDTFKKRANSMKIDKGNLGDLLMEFSLDYISKTIGIVNENETKIKDFDYNILKKDEWSLEEQQKIIDYTKRDIEITKKLYEFVEDYFESFKEFIDQKSIENKSYLTCSTAVITYKTICKILGLKEEYNQNVKGAPFDGGYVSYPAGEHFSGNIYCLDFNCLPEGELVHTVNGYKKIEDIQIGDVTVSMDGELNSFVAKREKVVDEIIELELKDGRILRQTPEHRIPTTNGLKQAKDLTLKDKLFDYKSKEIQVVNIKRIKGVFRVFDVSMGRQESPYFVHNGIFSHNSLYPHILMMGNVTELVDDGWSGGELFKTRGVYDVKKLGKIPELYKDLYHLRQEYKKVGDNREFAVKIYLNAGYGVLNNSSFKHVYQPIGGADIPFLGQQFIKLARKRFREAGYKNIYSDTDSLYLIDVFNDKEKMLKIKDDVIGEIKSSVPFPVEHFDMGIDDEIDDIWFFKGKNKKDSNDSHLDEEDLENKKFGLMKKNYIYITKGGKLKYKNLGTKKKSCSLLSRKIFRDVLIPKIINERKVKFSKSFFEGLIGELLGVDVTLVSKRFVCNRPEFYVDDSNLNAQIAGRFGDGIFFMVPVCRSVFDGGVLVSVGRGKRYVLLEDFVRLGLGVRDVDLGGVWKELAYFIEEERVAEDLSKWF